MTKQQPTGLDLLGLALDRWRTFAITIVLGIGAAIAYLGLADKWYEATLTVVPSRESKASLALNLSSKLPDVLETGSTDVQRIRAVLTSNSVADEVIDKLELAKRYGTPYREVARKKLWSHCRSNLDRKAEVVSLTCEDNDPKFALQMTALFGEVGNRVFGRVSASSAREERQFLEKQVVQARQDVDNASRELREFQEKNKIVDLPEQSKAVISAMASIEGELVSKQLELAYLNSFSSRTEANVVQLQRQIAIMKEKIGELEAPSQPAGGGSGSAAIAGEFFPGAMTVPALRFELERLLRQQKIKETLLLLITQRFEMARVDEARETSTFQILDHPTLPTYRSRPRPSKVLILGFMAGLVAGATVVGGSALRRRRHAAE
jgi:uncharacterized protein involved in exopolysaccharide biosynthesis